MEQELFQKITDEVIRTLRERGICPAPEQEAVSRILVIGEVSDLSWDGETGVPADLADYERYRDITRYSRVYITRLTLAELSDIAQGRDGFPASSAVVNALLRGMEVYLWEQALWHRKMKGRGRAALYERIERNVHQIESFGVRIVSGPGQPVQSQKTAGAQGMPEGLSGAGAQDPAAWIPAAGAQEGAVSAPAFRRRCLITERAADDLTKGGPQEVRVPKDAIITPAAWDVFTGHRVNVIRE